MAKFDIVQAARKTVVENGFSADFEPEVVNEIAAFDGHTPALTSGQRDLRDLLWSSIDNRESKDLDQIEASERLPNGDIRILVGIADVDVYAPKDSAIDKHAATATATLYTGLAVFPMLPERLSNELTSLLPKVDRAAMVVELVVDGHGEVSQEKVYRALVRNHAKLVYEDVAGWLAGHHAEPYASAVVVGMAEQVRMQSEAAERIRKARLAQGALELDTGEAHPVARDGEIVGLETIVASASRDLIAELMVAANGSIARYIDERGRSAIRRIVRTPKRWDRLVELAKSYGDELPDVPSRVALSGFVERRRVADPTRFNDVSLAVVKMLGPGEYLRERAGEAVGHFGLAVPEYAHSTAPNRRFPDLVTQRILKSILDGSPPPYTDGELDVIAARCTEREAAARKVERTMRKVAAALLLTPRMGEAFDAIVTGATPHGTFVRVIDPPAEGRIVKGEQGLDVGDALRVKLVATEPSRGFIDFVRI
jgi:VacB/RNase II family 3'-5' exoribonuclease